MEEELAITTRGQPPSRAAIKTFKVPVALTAISRPHGGLKHGQLPITRPPGSRTVAPNPNKPCGPLLI